MKALRHLVKKEFIQLRRTRSMIAISLGAPIIQLLILGFAISGDVIHVPTAIIDLDNTATSRSLLSKLKNTRYLDVRYRLTDIHSIIPLLQRGEAILAVTIPKNFERMIVRGEQPNVSVIADAQNSNVAVIGVGYIRQIFLSWTVSRGLSGVDDPAGFNLINLDSRILYNPELKSVYFMVPGILVILVTVITTILTAMAIVREREIGTLEQLMVTPISRVELILGKTIPFAFIGMIELIFALVVARLVYHIIIAGSIWLFLGTSLIYIFCTLGIGIFISTISHTQQQALFIAWFILVFCLLMSGFFLPLENMPQPIYYLTFINPLRYYMVIVMELFLKGATLSDILVQVSAIAVIAVIVMTAAMIRFNKRLG